jgi:cytochrome c oxidase cbb3-type subunit 3
MDNSALTDHAYDGIQEFDNPLPGWWKWMFVGSIVFSVFYAMYFHIGAPGRTIFDQYDAEVSAAAQKQFAKIGELKPTASAIMLYDKDLAEGKDSWLKVGQTIFKANCISCHGRDGEGKVGPNLTDEYFKNIRKVEDIGRVLINGAGNGAMPAWSNRLGMNEIVLVSAYVASLRGKNMEGKGPEGSEIPPWPEPPTADVEKPGSEEAVPEGAAPEQAASDESAAAAEEGKAAKDEDSTAQPTQPAGEKSQ